MRCNRTNSKERQPSLMQMLKIPAIVVTLAMSLSGQVTIVNNASFRVEQPVAAGSWVAAFGAFTGVQTATATSFPLPKTLGGVRVTVGGVEAALYDVRASQITFLIPNTTAPGLHPVQIVGPTTITGSVRVISSAPGLFTKDAKSPPQGAIRNQDGVTENSSTARGFQSCCGGWCRAWSESVGWNAFRPSGIYWRH
jgi:hypothetical protein